MAGFPPGAVEDNPALYLSKQDTVLLSRAEEEFIDVETHRMLLLLRAKKLKQAKLGQPVSVPGETAYAVFGPF